ncbi:hypothetical protein OOU_Y34scaffold00775g5 [Pyricularia oryzae Y34]|uniref:Uncharacterized protein n=1 Tax=Pyricularia oryzae (strain Y34) TaxID=1143189 RepID=A0AA97NQ14_PYRO3|nr:hypothetical protein OOU_Y34scaffold00775g5 [Pyricularia oryzae Y34]
MGDLLSCLVSRSYSLNIASFDAAKSLATRYRSGDAGNDIRHDEYHGRRLCVIAPGSMRR